LKTFILAILISVVFQAHAQDEGDGLDISEKRRLEKLEREVSNLGAERERARAAKQETHTQIKHNIRGITDRTRLDILEKRRLEKLEREVSNLGAERERARAAK